MRALQPYARAEVGGRRCRQPGQVRKEAATTISCRVVGFHRLFRLGIRTRPASVGQGGRSMSDFEFLFSVFGLLIGLTFIEVAIKFADAIDAHSRRPVGVLTPLLALFVMIDVAGYWVFAWSVRDLLHVRWRTVFVGLSVALAYYLAASMIFPRS